MKHGGKGPGGDSPSSTELNGQASEAREKKVINERPSGSSGRGAGCELWETLVLTGSALPQTLTLKHTLTHQFQGEGQRYMLMTALKNDSQYFSG